MEIAALELLNTWTRSLHPVLETENEYKLHIYHGFRTSQTVKDCRKMSINMAE
jgi:hypothetical protein